MDARRSGFDGRRHIAAHENRRAIRDRELNQMTAKGYALHLCEVFVAQQQPAAAALENGGRQRRQRQARLMTVGDHQDRRVGQVQDPDPINPSCGLDGSP